MYIYMYNIIHKTKHKLYTHTYMYVCTCTSIYCTCTYMYVSPPPTYLLYVVVSYVHVCANKATCKLCKSAKMLLTIETCNCTQPTTKYPQYLSNKYQYMYKSVCTCTLNMYLCIKWRLSFYSAGLHETISPPPLESVKLRVTHNLRQSMEWRLSCRQVSEVLL